MSIYTAVGNKTKNLVASSNTLVGVRKKVAFANHDIRHQDIWRNDTAIIILKDGDMIGYIAVGIRMMKGRGYKDNYSEMCLWYHPGKDLKASKDARILMGDGNVIKNPNAGLKEDMW